MVQLLKSPRIYLILIILLAIFLRFNNLNWDANFHLHPDERFLTMVGTAMKIPSNVFDYLNSHISSMNPTNINFPFFVYGVFPVTLNKILAVIFSNDNYNGYTIQGRFLSAFFDILTVILVYKTAKLLFSKETSNLKHLIFNIPLWAAFFYAIAVLPIQLSHFFAVDTFLNFFMLASFYFALKFHYFSSGVEKNISSNRSRPDFAKASTGKQARTIKWLVFSAIFFGLALSSKINALFILPLNLFFILTSVISTERSEWRNPFKNGVSKIVFLLLIYIFISYFTVRLANPYYFESSNFFNLLPNKLFVENLKSLKSFEGKDIWFPPAIQWISKNPLFSVVNLAVFGLGIPYFILALLGILYVILEGAKRLIGSSKILSLRTLYSLQNDRVAYTRLMVLLWVLGFFVYQSLQFVKAMRYFIFIYPFLAIFAGIGVDRLSFWLVQNRFWMRLSTSSRLTRMTVLKVLLILILLIWPLAFASIYTTKNSRVEASEWIYQNIPNSSLLLSEHWDDALPLGVQQNYGKQFTIKELPVFAPDDKEKWKQMNDLLSQADYYILSSNRGWGSVPTVPEKYPKMAKFYQELLANNLPHYKKVAEFTSYPSIQFQISNFKFQIPFSDQWSDESFTVYDHPKVMIYKKI